MANPFDDILPNPSTAVQTAPTPRRTNPFDDILPDSAPSRLATTSPGAAFLTSAIDELTSALPIRRIPELIQAVRAGQEAKAGRPELARQLAAREAIQQQLAAEHPIASGLGRAAGFAPALAVGGMASKALPLARLAQAGLRGRLASEAIRSGAQFGTAELVQGRPEEVPRGVALGAAFAPARLAATPFRRALIGAPSVGLTSAALAPPGRRLEAGAFGTAAGAIGGALERPLVRPRPVSGGLPGAVPESVLIPAERISIEEAATAAREGLESIKPRPFVRTTELQNLEQFAAQFPGLFPRDFKTRALKTYEPLTPAEQQRFKGLLPSPPIEGRVVRPGERGFVFIPEETPQAIRATAKIGAFAAAENRLRLRADELSNRINGFQDRLGIRQQRAELIEREAETIAQTGTISPEARPVFRDLGQPPQTLSVEFSEQQIAQNQAELVRLSRETAQLRQTLSAVGDQASVNGSMAAHRALREAQVLFGREVERFRKLRFAAGRAVKRFDIPPDLAAALQEAGVLTSGLRTVKARLPIYTNIIRSLKNIHQLTPQEQQQFGRDLVDAWRLNLFAVTSWTLDLGGNLAETAAQVGGAIGRDIGQVTQGRLTFPSLQGFFRAIRRQDIPPQVSEGIEQQVAGGEVVRLGGFRKGAGTFTTRTTPASTAVDYLVGSPLYAKGMVDQGFRRFVATSHLWRQAIEAADRQGLRGLERRAFYDRFWLKTPQEAIDATVREGNKAGFARGLSSLEERIAGSTAMRLFGDAFARWPFQFTRALAEWVGINPQMWRRIATGRSVPDLGEYLGKTLTGWGGLWLVNELLYDHVDWRSMEYVLPTGNRVRLSGRDPIPSMLFLLATIRGDRDASVDALRFASLPFARILTGFAPGQKFEGGLLGGLMGNISRAIEQRQVMPRALRRELENTVNKLIPGQSILSALKTAFDPVLREGIGANLPGVSLALPPAISPTTGEPIQPRQRVAGVELPQIGGTPIPGAERILDPVQQLLSKLGLLVYRGPRSPIAGIPASQLDESVRREWLIELGRQRQRLLLPLTRQDWLRRLETDVRFREALKRRVQALDRVAAKRATIIVQRRYGGKRPTPRTLTARERALPRRFTQ